MTSERMTNKLPSVIELRMEAEHYRDIADRLDKVLKDLETLNPHVQIGVDETPRETPAPVHLKSP